MPQATTYKVVKCGASGHNVRSSPSLTAPPIGMLHFGNHITVVKHVSQSFTNSTLSTINVQIYNLVNSSVSVYHIFVNSF